MNIQAMIEARIAAEMTKRKEAGLLVEWSAIPDPRGGTREFSAYATDEKQKAAWIKNGERKGWVLKK